MVLMSKLVHHMMLYMMLGGDEQGQLSHTGIVQRCHCVWHGCWQSMEIWCAIQPPSQIWQILTITLWWHQWVRRQHRLVLLLCGNTRRQRQR